MTDDKELIARLRESQSYEWQDAIWETRLAAADRIEALTAENAKLHDHIEGVAKNTHKIMVGYEAKLEHAKKGLRKIIRTSDMHSAWDIAIATVEKLE